MPPQEADQHGATLEALCADLAATRHVIVASNQRPVSFTGRGNDALSAGSGSIGNLAALQGKLPLTWVSVAASGADREVARQAGDGPITAGLPEGWAARFVTPSRRVHHRYYNIICNPLLWFLHHRAWGFTHTPNVDREAATGWDQGMMKVSRMFAAEIAAEAERSERPVAIMLRGFHMHLVGGMVRSLVPGASIHYAVDVPWPGPGDWLMMPAEWREEIFSSLLECDVVGLTSDRDVRALMGCFEEFVPGVEIDRDARRVAVASGRAVQLKTYSPSVDHDALIAVAESHRTEAYVERFRDDSRHTFVTAERAEPHKNIVRCIRAYGSLLDRERSLAGETRYLLVLAPPPPHLSQYRRYVSEIERTARTVNDRHGGAAGGPVELIFENNYPMALAALRLADTVVSVPIADAAGSTALAAPLINRRDCSLILSAASSVAEAFGDAAPLVSPSDVEAIGEEMLRSVGRTEQDRKDQFSRLESVALGQTDDAVVAGQIGDVLGLGWA